MNMTPWGGWSEGRMKACSRANKPLNRNRHSQTAVNERESDFSCMRDGLQSTRGRAHGILFIVTCAVRD